MNGHSGENDSKLTTNNIHLKLTAKWNDLYNPNLNEHNKNMFLIMDHKC